MGDDTECLHTQIEERARNDIAESGHWRPRSRDWRSSTGPVLLIQMRRPFQLFAPIVERTKIRERETEVTVWSFLSSCKIVTLQQLHPWYVPRKARKCGMKRECPKLSSLEEPCRCYRERNLIAPCNQLATFPERLMRVSIKVNDSRVSRD